RVGFTKRRERRPHGLIMWTVREAFCAALEGPLETRDELLAQFPSEIRSEVVSLLAAHEAAGGFLSPPAEDVSPIHSRVGPYRLVEKLGEGGMGVVYRARRDDGEFEREVAIKFVGGRLFAPEAERRFIAERRILARLDHPNIARMIDGGIWQGRRFLVMELVLGEPITQYALKPGVTLPRRLQLLQAICSSMSYAHQHLVMQ